MKLPRVKLLASLRDIFGAGEIFIKLGNVSLEQLGFKLRERDQRFSQIFDEKGRPRPGILVLINSKDYRLFKGRESNYLVSDEDTITILPVNHGG